MNPLIFLNGLLVLLFGDYLVHCLDVWIRLRRGELLPVRLSPRANALRSFVMSVAVFVLVVTPFLRTLFPGSPPFIASTLYGIALVVGLYLAISWRWPEARKPKP